MVEIVIRGSGFEIIEEYLAYKGLFIDSQKA
jgi:hypothetical protein